MLKLERGDWYLRIRPNPGFGFPISASRRGAVRLKQIREHDGRVHRPIVRVRKRNAVTKGRPHEGGCGPACRHR